LGVFKALGDSTRYAIYVELTRAASPMPTAELAERLELHPNTVRPHLERMREVGLLEMTVDAHGAVGRPQHCWAAVAAAPSLGLEPVGFRLLAHLLADVAARGGLGDDEVLAIGRTRGRDRVRPDAPEPVRGTVPADPVRTPAAACLQALVDQLADLGFDPSVEEQAVGEQAVGEQAVGEQSRVAVDGRVTVAFSRCPFRELAAAFPDLVCRLHHGLTQGLLDNIGGREGVEVEMRAFATLVDVDPCRVELQLHRR